MAEELVDVLRQWSGEAWCDALCGVLPSFDTPDVELSYGGPTDKFGNGVVSEFVGVEPFRALSALLASPHARAVRSLRLCYHKGLSDAELEVLCEGLARNDQLEKLSLYGTGISSVAPLHRLLQEDNNSLLEIDVTDTEAESDAQATANLWWDLCANGQPLRLKQYLARLRQCDPELRELVIDDHRSLRLCDDSAMKMLVAALIGAPVIRTPLLPPHQPVCSKNVALQALLLPRNAVTAEGTDLLSRYLPFDSVLTELDLSGNPLGAQGCSSLANALAPPRGNTTLRTLSLNCVNAGTAGGNALAAVISAGASLSMLRMAQNSMQQCGAAFVRAAQVSTSLEVLDLDGNGIVDEHMERIAARSLLQHCPAAVRRAVPQLHANYGRLTHLCLGASGEGGGVDDASAAILAESLRCNDRLQELDLSGSPLSCVGLGAICAVLSENGASGLRSLLLKKLRLGPRTYKEQTLGTRPAALICRMLESHRSISEVYLDGSYLEPGAGKLFYALTRRLRRLRVLSTDRCEGHPPAADIRNRLDLVLSAHAHPPPLISLCWSLWEGGVMDGALDLSKDGVLCAGECLASCTKDGGAAADVLCQCVQQLPNVTAINVSGQSELSDEGCRRLVDLLDQQEQLTGLNIAQCNISTPTAEKLADCIRKHTRVHEAVVSGNLLLSADMTAAIAAALRFNLASKGLKALLTFAQVGNAAGTPGPLVYDQPPSGEEICDTDCAWVVETLIGAEVPRASVVNFSNNPISSEGAIALAAFLQHPASHVLRSLSLRNCMIDDAGAIEVLRAVGGHPSVAELDLSRNHIGAEGQSAALRAIQDHGNLLVLRMDSEDTQPAYKAFASSLTTAEQLNARPDIKHALQSLVARDNVHTELVVPGVGRALVAPIAEVMCRAATLRRVDLSHGEADDHCAGVLANAIDKDVCAVTHLILSHNRISTPGCRLLASAVSTSHTIQALALDHNTIDGKGAQAMIDALRTNRSLLSLDLRGNVRVPALMLDFLQKALINDQPFLKAVIPRVQLNDESVSELLLRGECGGCTPATDLTLQLASEALLLNFTVKVVDFSGGCITAAGTEPFAEMLQANTGIQQLRMDSCALTSASAGPIAHALRCNSTLRLLSLKDNHLCELFSQLLLKVLTEDNYTLHEVMLGGNERILRDTVAQIEDKVSLNRCPPGLKQVMPHVIAERVTCLNLRGAGKESPLDQLHGDETAFRLAALLSKCATLRAIDLSNNRIGPAGGEALAQSLGESAPGLLSLNLSGNAVSEAGNAFRVAMASNTVLRVLDISSNGIPGPTEQTINLLTECNVYPSVFKGTVLRYLRHDPPQDLILRADQLFSPPATVCAGIDLPQQRPLIDDRAVEVFCGFLMEQGSAFTVAFPGNSITSDGARRIAGVLQHGSEVNRLDLSGNNIDDAGGCAVVEALLSSRTLTDVNLSENQLTDSTAMQALRAVREKASIRDINLSDNDSISEARMEELNWFLTLNFKTEECKVLTSRIIDNDPSLTHLDLRGGVGSGLFDNAGEGYAADTLQLILGACNRNKNIVSLDISSNGRRVVDQLAIIGDFVRSSLQLRKLDLSFNPLGAPGELNTLLSILQYSLTLRHLDLQHCGLTDDVWEGLSKSVKAKHSVLEFIDLRHNRITSAILPLVTDVCAGAARACADSGILLVPQDTELDADLITQASTYVRVDLNEPSEITALRSRRLTELRGDDRRV
eukprot:TRINITY_DN9634_c1_g1_i1.p1 TRINITY_DN9634_c1_g1~~TRINITY_DN9634_c1_g1_i1.p1  ORF type:complete len:1715 (+),score=264.55 TRINITY_DN9634_c1_g1_i1:60-5204(+)